MTDSDPRNETDTLRSKLQDADAGVQFDIDRRHLLKMSDNMRLVPSKIGDHRHLKLLRHNTRMACLAQPPSLEDFRDNDEAEHFGIDDEEDVDDLLEDRGLLGVAIESRAAAEALVRWINSTYSNEHTNQDYRTALRSFGRYRKKLDEPPEALAWIPTGTSNNFDPTPSERDMLTHEGDILPMIESALNARDKALIALQFEAGLRGGELYDLRIGDVFDGEHTTGIHVDGKEGERPVHLIVAVPYLQRWLTEHPAGDDETAWLWSKLSSPDRPSYASFLNYFKMAAERADVSKDVTPTNFRKSNTRWLVLMGFSQPRIEDRQGRKRGSEHTARYMARFGEDSNEREYARIHGHDIESDEPEDVGPIECPRCMRDTPRDRSFCMWCNFALSHDATERLDDAVDSTVDELVDASDPESRQMFAEFLRFMKENPHRLPDDHDEASASSD